MARIQQKAGGKGSQKWLQIAVEQAPAALQPARLPALDWLSPRAADAHAEYMDGDFLRRLGLPGLVPSLAAFWPVGGPRWDGLARAGKAVVLVEAKAHLREALSTPCAATAPASRARIAAALAAAKAGLGADERSDWMRCFYQYANRLAHLWWLHRQGVAAHLLLVGFVGDRMVGRAGGGPDRGSEWQALYLAADHALGLSAAHPMARFIHHVHPDVTTLPEGHVA